MDYLEGLRILNKTISDFEEESKLLSKENQQKMKYLIDNARIYTTKAGKVDMEKAENCIEGIEFHLNLIEKYQDKKK